VLQDQASRTGLLFSGAFTLDQETVVQSLNVGVKEWSRDRTKDYLYHDGTYSGDWFQSRSLKVQRLASLRSTRAAVTLMGRDSSGVPQVVSSFNELLGTLMIKDAGGTWWKGENVRTGERVTLQKASSEDCRAVWSEAMRDAHEITTRQIEKVHVDKATFGLPNHFYATLLKPEAIPTLHSIRWEDKGVALGPVENAPEAVREGGVQ
jgi:hypothetical protein